MPYGPTFIWAWFSSSSTPFLCSVALSDLSAWIHFLKSGQLLTRATYQAWQILFGGSQQIRHYQGQDYFFARYQKQLQTSLGAEINYEKQRTLNSLFINSIDAFCSVTPIVIGGFMTYYNYLDAASFVAIYLVSHNIGYQFQELAYFTNTRKATRTLLNKYQELLGQSDSTSPRSIENISLSNLTASP